MTFGKQVTEATERRKREISKYGKPLSLEACRRYKQQNLGRVKENWRSWASDNKVFRRNITKSEPKQKRTVMKHIFLNSSGLNG